MASRKPRASATGLIRAEHIGRSILLIRGEKVMLDAEIARLYGVTVGRLNEAVKRNRNRFPPDFMFQLTKEEFNHLEAEVGTGNLKSQIAISSSGWGGRRSRPYAFTEHGVEMLSSVLRSERAVWVNIAIMRAFVRLRETLALHRDLATRLADLERKIVSQDAGIKNLFEAIRQLMAPPAKARRSIGFRVEEAGPVYQVRRARRTGRKS
jgi:hypothetical protein